MPMQQPVLNKNVKYNNKYNITFGIDCMMFKSFSFSVTMAQNDRFNVFKINSRNAAERLHLSAWLMARAC